MNTTVRYPLTLYYDAACPVCALEMDHLRARDTHGRLVLIDIAEPGFDAAAHGATLQAMDAQIHARHADGRWSIGVEALRFAYDAVGLGWLWRPTGWPLLEPLADHAYRLFARHRRAISGRAAPLIDAIRARRAAAAVCRMQACRDGACAHDAAAMPRDPFDRAGRPS